MRKEICFFLITLMLGGLSACSSPEELAQQQYQLAVQMEEAGETGRAEKLYQRVLAVFPGSEAAARSAKQIKRIVWRRELALRREYQQVLERLQLIVEGYRSMEKSYPQFLAELDHGDYMFDSDYMAETVPDDFTAYLLLSSASPPYRIWAIKEGSGTVITLDGDSKELKDVAFADLHDQLEKNYRIETQKGRLMFLRDR